MTAFFFLNLTFFSKLVIDASLLGVRQNLVSFCNLLKLVLRVWVAVLVWVELESQLPVGLLDLVLIGFVGDA